VWPALLQSGPAIDDLAQGILFESEAKFERMQAFLDRKKDNGASEK
jgi:enoyl-CoA hydratase